MSLEKQLAGSNPMLFFQIRNPSTGVTPPTTLFHGLLYVLVFPDQRGGQLEEEMPAWSGLSQLSAAKY